MVKRKQNGAPFCGWCANGFHKRCPGGCACGAREHRPSMEVAARMFASARPDQRGLPEAERARMWRETCGAEPRTTRGRKVDTVIVDEHHEQGAML